MSSLGEFHHEDEAPSSSSKLISWAVIAVIVCLAGGYVAWSGMLTPDTNHPAQSYPRGL